MLEQSERSPKRPDFRVVAGKTDVGDGPNRLELYPLGGETAERHMMVYFPEHKMLYGSDPFQRDDDGAYTPPQTVWLSLSWDLLRECIRYFILTNFRPC